MPRLTARHLAEMKGRYEPQRAFDWLVEFPIAGGQEVVKMTVEQAFLPTEMNEPIELHYGNEVQYAAGKARWEFGQLSIRDMVDLDVARYISNWRARVYDPVGGDIHFAKDYKEQGYVILLAPDGSVERTWKVEGLWPTSVSYGALDYTANDIVRIQCTVAFDRAYRI